MTTDSFTWRHKLGIYMFVLVLLICKTEVIASMNAGPPGKFYARGNHWAVGHLMGKKSTDFVCGPGKGELVGNEHVPEKVQELRRLKPEPQPITSLPRALTVMRSLRDALLQEEALVKKRGQWKEYEQRGRVDRNVREMAGILLKLLSMESNSAT